MLFKKKVAHLQAQIRQSAAPAGVINQPHGRPPKSPKNAATPRGGHHGSWGRQLCHLHGPKNGVTMKTGNFTWNFGTLPWTMVTLFSKYDSTIVFWCSIAYNMAYIPPQKKKRGNSHLPGSCRDSSTSSRLPNAKCHCRGATAAPVCGTCHIEGCGHFLTLYVTFNSPKCDNSIPLLLLHVTEPFPTATQNGTPENQDPASKYLATREEGVNSNKLWATSDLDQTLELFKSRAVPPSEILMAPWTCNTTYNYRGWYLGMTVGSWFCSCKVVLPSPKHYIIHAQAHKKITKKTKGFEKRPFKIL